jgi:1,4-alpha-glucan branching enzyme
VIADSDIDALLRGEHRDPFAVLGLHSSAGSWWLRALLPGADRVVAVDAAGAMLGELARRHADGFFEAPLAIDGARAYRLKLRWHDGSEGCYADAYAFGPLLDEAALDALREGRHGRPFDLLGAHPQSIDGVAGVRFAVWAPNARRVSVVGSFNNWDGRRHPMRLRHRAGVYELFVPHAAPGDLYKFEILAANGALYLKSDPFAFAAELRPHTASAVAGLPPLRALPADRHAANRREAPISIYEVHVGSWRYGEQEPNWRTLADTLPAYAAALGFTHVELMPIAEFPFDGSWGYQPTGLFAPSSRFGSAADFAHFVAACQSRGIGVLLDWVPAHFPADAHGLAQFDGTALYEYPDPKEGFHRDWNTLIYNFSRTEVRSFLKGSARYWLERFGLDGLRVDAVASMLYRDYSRNAGEWLPNAYGGRENLEAISLFKELNEDLGSACPGTMTVAEESTAYPQVSAPTYAGGLGFHYKWNMGWMNDTLGYIAEDPIHRRWHHDKLSFGLVYAFSENYVLPISHDEVVHGKGSMLGKMPGDDWQRFANLRAYYGFMWGHPGKKLLFMGQEFAQRDEWNHDRALPWQLLDDARHRGVQQLVCDLNRLYRDLPALHRLDYSPAGFDWLVGDDRDNSVLAWARFDGQDGAAIVVCNFTPVPRHAYRIPMGRLRATRWREALNTDSMHYGGSNLGNGAQPIEAHGGAIELTLPPLAALFLVPA